MKRQQSLSKLQDANDLALGILSTAAQIEQYLARDWRVLKPLDMRHALASLLIQERVLCGVILAQDVALTQAPADRPMFNGRRFASAHHVAAEICDCVNDALLEVLGLHSRIVTNPKTGEQFFLSRLIEFYFIPAIKEMDGDYERLQTEGWGIARESDAVRKLNDDLAAIVGPSSIDVFRRHVGKEIDWDGLKQQINWETKSLTATVPTAPAAAAKRRWRTAELERAAAALIRMHKRWHKGTPMHTWLAKRLGIDPRRARNLKAWKQRDQMDIHGDRAMQAAEITSSFFASLPPEVQAELQRLDAAAR